MIQFNLLPDVKLEYVKATRNKQLVMLVSFIVTGISIGLLVILFIGVNVLQKNHLNNLNKDIKAKTQKLQSVQDIDKILTIQNQLNSLDGLHDAKPATERLGTYLAQVTPSDVIISDITVDYSADTMVIDCGAGSIRSVNGFIDTLKFTKFHVDDQDKNAFSSVVLNSFDRANQQGKNATGCKINLNFDPGIFDITKDVKLTVPNQVTTRSVTERPTSLFQQTTTGGQ